jgi:hypothetical protein
MLRFVYVLSLSASLALCGCKKEGDLEPPGRVGNEPGAGEEISPKDKVGDGATPGALAAEAAGYYVEGLEGMKKLLTRKMTLDKAKAQLIEVREATIQKLVAVGKKREVLDSKGKVAFDLALQKALMKTPKGLFHVMNNGVKRYRNIDLKFANEIATMNVITQYANFDLLRTQLPLEAKRLGVY